jgi:hypothetical protein
MIKKSFRHIFLILLVILLVKTAGAQQPAIDYMHIPGPILFDNETYYLAWSSRPVDNYYKQEYIAKGDSLEHFKRLVLLDVLEDTVKPADLVYLKIKDLNKRKKTDLVVKYNLIESPDSSQYLIDFVESEGMPKIDFVEWNAYLYKAFIDKKGHKGVMLFGVSTRSYGNNAADFIGALSNLRESVIQQLIKYPVPEVNLD